MRQAQPQYVTLQDHDLSGEPRPQNSMYAPAPVTHGHPVHRAPPPQPEQRQIYYGGQQVDMQTPVITQAGQTVYLNAPAPYGYATVQYHPHQQPQIIRQTVPGRGHPHEQYVSVVPIQGGQLASIAGGQTYAYWPPDGTGASLAVPQVTIMNAAGPGGAPIAVARIGNPTMDVAHANNGYGGGRGKDKGRKGGRNGGTPSSRRGGEAKHSPHSMSSPLLEEFRATKSRDWTIRDIEGHVVEFCQDQNGSRFIQQRLEIGDATEQKLVMNEVLPAINRLRNDVFGNYVVQKLLEFGTMQMKSDIRDTLQGEMLQLSLQMYG
jgi:Pumilio-family RNA binding repeat